MNKIHRPLVATALVAAMSAGLVPQALAATATHSENRSSAPAGVDSADALATNASTSPGYLGTPWPRGLVGNELQDRSRLSSSKRAEQPGMASPQKSLYFMGFLP